MDLLSWLPTIPAYRPLMTGWMYNPITEKMKPVPEKPLHYTVDGIDTITFRPFYEFKENERYFLYHDTTAHATKFHKK